MKTSTIKAIIVEDEEWGIENLKSKLARNCPQIEIIGICTNGEEAIQKIYDLNPQLVFMDIELKGSISGFKVLERLASIDFLVIFTTKFDQYAIEAIRASALDYLVKPIDEDELVAAINRVKKKYYRDLAIAEKLVVPWNRGLKFIDPNDILYFKVEDKHTWIHFSNDQKKILVTKALNSIQANLPQADFLRIFNNCVVNLNYVKEYLSDFGGAIELTNGEKLRVNERVKKQLKEMFRNN